MTCAVVTAGQSYIWCVATVKISTKSSFSDVKLAPEWTTAFKSPSREAPSATRWTVGER